MGGKSGSSPFFVAYFGPSMNPTLIEPEMLDILSYDGGPIQPGDVILFHCQEQQKSIVHRVVSVTASGIRTRGDNNAELDPYVLQTKDVLGRVVAAWRGKKRREIAGGHAGVRLCFWIRVRRALKGSVYRGLRFPYHTISRSALFQRLLPQGLRPRIVFFRNGEAGRHNLIMGNRIIGRYDTRLAQWSINAPFRLFVNERSLPLAGDREKGF